MQLLSYRFKRVVPFGDGEYSNVYILTFRARFLFFFSKTIEIEHSISMFVDIASQEKTWDNLIINKTFIHKKQIK